MRAAKHHVQIWPVQQAERTPVPRPLADLNVERSHNKRRRRRRILPDADTLLARWEGHLVLGPRRR